MKIYLNGKNILIVDQEKASGDILAAKLLNGGYSSSHVHSYEAAISLIVKELEFFDAVLVSSGQSLEKSLDFYKRLHDLGQTHSVAIPPLAAYSHQRELDYIKNIISFGYQEFFVRPIEPEVLWDKLERLIDKNKKIDLNTFVVKVQDPGEIRFEVEVVAINDVGLVFSTNTNLKIGFVLAIACPILAKAGIAKIDVRVTHCEMLENKYTISATYLSIHPQQARAILNTMNELKKLNKR